MMTTTVDLTGKTRVRDVALAIIEAGGSDEIKPSPDLIARSLAFQIGTVSVIDNNWIALRDKKGVTLYHFYAPVVIKR